MFFSFLLKIASKFPMVYFRLLAMDKNSSYESEMTVNLLKIFCITRSFYNKCVFPRSQQNKFFQNYQRCNINTLILPYG